MKILVSALATFSMLGHVLAATTFVYDPNAIKYKIRRTKTDCIDHNLHVCSNLVCELKAYSREVDVLNLGCNVTRPMDDIMLQLTYYYKYGTIFRKFLIDYTLDICALMGGKNGKSNENSNKVAETFVQSFVNGNQKQLVHPCPYVGPHYIYNYTQFELMGQAMMPEGEYRVETRYYSDKTNQTILHNRIYATLKSKNPMLDMRLG